MHGDLSKVDTETIKYRTQHSLNCLVPLHEACTADYVMVMQQIYNTGDAEVKCNYFHFPGGWTSALQNFVQ